MSESVFEARNDGAPLEPLNENQARLADACDAHVTTMVRKGHEYQVMLDAEHRSEFNPFLLYLDGVAYSQRCDAAGAPDPAGAFWRGVRAAVESSVDPHYDYVSIDHEGDSDRLVCHFGERRGDEQTGILVDTRYPFNRYRLTKQIAAAYRKRDCDFEIVEDVTPTDSALKIWRRADDVDEAMREMDGLVSEYLQRVSLEAKFFNLFRKRPNMIEVHDDNLQEYIHIEGEGRPTYPDKVLLVTSTRVCRRCRAEFDELFTDYTGRHPEIFFGLVFTDKPKLKFVPHVFEGHCGGVRRSGLVTPFVIPYRRGRYCGRYLATGKHEPPPSIADVDGLVEEFFS